MLLEAATVAAKRAAAEREEHAPMHVHCAVSADASRRCEAATRSLLESVRDAVPQPGPIPGRGDGPDSTGSLSPDGSGVDLREAD